MPDSDYEGYLDITLPRSEAASDDDAEQDTTTGVVTTPHSVCSETHHACPEAYPSVCSETLPACTEAKPRVCSETPSVCPRDTPVPVPRHQTIQSLTTSHRVTRYPNPPRDNVNRRGPPIRDIVRRVYTSKGWRKWVRGPKFKAYVPHVDPESPLDRKKVQRGANPAESDRIAEAIFNKRYPRLGPESTELKTTNTHRSKPFTAKRLQSDYFPCACHKDWVCWGCFEWPDREAASDTEHFLEPGCQICGQEHAWKQCELWLNGYRNPPVRPGARQGNRLATLPKRFDSAVGKNKSLTQQLKELHTHTKEEHKDDPCPCPSLETTGVIVKTFSGMESQQVTDERQTAHDKAKRQLDELEQSVSLDTTGPGHQRKR